MNASKDYGENKCTFLPVFKAWQFPPLIISIPKYCNRFLEEEIFLND